jgi:CRP/FNR family transcriptional regulator, cyclic AMP receptor protein
MPDYVIEALGYLASSLVFAAFYMKTMVPLRCVAIGSNIAFLSYGICLGLWPIAILHALMLPLNTLRLVQIRRMLTGIRAARGNNIDVSAIARSFELVRYPKGTVLFQKGDRGDCAYYIAEGEIEFPEIGVRCSLGDLFGEIALFSPEHTRTASAICASDVELYRIDEHAIVVAFHQSAPFAFSILRLVTRRLLENISNLETRTESRPEALDKTPAQAGTPLPPVYSYPVHGYGVGAVDARI